MITWRFVNECFTYCANTGALVWKTRPLYHFKCEHGYKSFNAKLSGVEAGSEQKHYLTGKSYRSVGLNGKRYMTHQLICLIVAGSFTDQVDHLDGNGLNNRLNNLRFVDKNSNARNQKQRCDNTTGLTGVTFYSSNAKAKWRSRINHEGKRLSKTFDNLLDAACWRKSKEVEYGYHERHGEVRAL